MDLNNWHLANRGRDTVRRDGKLYDRYNHTFKFDDDPTYVDITYILDWTDLPAPIQAYVTARAATIVSSRLVGDTPNIKCSNRRKHIAGHKQSNMNVIKVIIQCLDSPKVMTTTSLQTVSHSEALMAAVTQLISTYTGGVSTQPDVKKLSGQVREADNCFADPTFGMTKRSGSRYLANLADTPALKDAKWFFILRDNREAYIGAL